MDISNKPTSQTMAEINIVKSLLLILKKRKLTEYEHNLLCTLMHLEKYSKVWYHEKNI